jgi:hypothetical protein
MLICVEMTDAPDPELVEEKLIELFELFGDVSILKSGS